MDFTKFLSRKLIVTVLAAVAGFMGWGDIPSEVMQWLAGIVMIYVAGQSAVDVAEVKKGKKSK